MVTFRFFIKLFAFGSILHPSQTENLPSLLQEGLVSRSYGLIETLNSENGNSVHEIILITKMPKRVKTSLVQKSKKARRSASDSPSKRNSIPRSCKNTSVSKKGIVDFDFLTIPNNKYDMESNQAKQNEKNKDSRRGKDNSVSMSEDELDVVFDVQEEKKNKIYEVITVMSDDETPNQITYERIYADDPEKRVVDESEIKELLSKTLPPTKTNLNEDIVGDIVKEANLIKENASNTKKSEKSTEIIKLDDRVMAINTDTKDDSDDEIICVAVLDPKTKAEQKRASVEEICLSSDSEPEIMPKISPIRLKLPYSGYPYVNKYYRSMNESENSYGSNNSNFGSNNSHFSLGFGRPAGMYSYVFPSKSDEASDWDSNSTRSKPSTVQDSSPAPSESPKALGGDDSSSSSSSSVRFFSDSSQHHQNLSPRSDSSNNENPSSPTPSSDDEERDIYWKADRESRRKVALRHEEFTDFGRKIHEGEIDIDINTTFTFKVMSYNVLAQTLLESHIYLYKDHDRRTLSWARRWSLIYEEIKDENPEILCLQEVDTAHLATHYAKLLDLGYRWVYKKRTGKNHDGVAVFYKAAIFYAEAHSQVEFFQPAVSVLDRDNVGLVLRLRLRNSLSHAVVVATTHLLYNPRRSDVRLAQVQLLLAEIDRLAYNKDALTYYPVILTGDFNLKPHNGVYQLLTEGSLCYEGASRRNLRISSSDSADKNILPRTLLPWRLGITDRCQHVDVLEARVKGEDATTTRLYNSELNRSPHRDDDDAEDFSKDDRFESGCLSHGFNFQSVYTHSRPDGQLEASTHHESWVTVDYIFYSTPKTKDGQKKVEGSLQLLSRLRLPTQDECDRILRHLPNFAFGSDHLPLIAKFLMQLKYPSGQYSKRRHTANALKSSPASSSEDRATPVIFRSSSQNPQVPTIFTHRKTRQYSREFLLSCKSTDASQTPPANWDQIVEECPGISLKEPGSSKPTQEEREIHEEP